MSTHRHEPQQPYSGEPQLGHHHKFTDEQRLSFIAHHASLFGGGADVDLDEYRKHLDRMIEEMRHRHEPEQSVEFARGVLYVCDELLSRHIHSPHSSIMEWAVKLRQTYALAACNTEEAKIYARDTERLSRMSVG